MVKFVACLLAYLKHKLIAHYSGCHGIFKFINVAGRQAEGTPGLSRSPPHKVANPGEAYGGRVCWSPSTKGAPLAKGSGLWGDLSVS